MAMRGRRRPAALLGREVVSAAGETWAVHRRLKPGGLSAVRKRVSRMAWWPQVAVDDDRGACYVAILFDDFGEEAEASGGD